MALCRTGLGMELPAIRSGVAVADPPSPVNTIRYCLPLLFTVDRVSDRAVDNHAADDRFPKDGAGIGVESAQPAIEITEEHEVAGRGERRGY